MALEGQVVEQPAKTEQTLLSCMFTDRRTQLTQPPEPAPHMGIATKLGKPVDLGKVVAKIGDEVVGHVLVFDDRERLQGQRKILDLLLENLFEAVFGLTHDIRGEIKRARLATAR